MTLRDGFSNEQEPVNYSVPETAQFRLEDLKAAMRGSWPMSAQLDPKTFQLLRDRVDGNGE